MTYDPATEQRYGIIEVFADIDGVKISYYDKQSKTRDRIELRQYQVPNELYPPKALESDKVGCHHAFAFWMVVPPNGAWITCTVCGARNFVHGSQVTW